MPQRIQGDEQVFTSKTGTGTSTGFLVNGRRHVKLVLVSTGTTALTFKVKGAVLGNVTLTDAASSSNPWDYLSFYNLNSPSSVIVGDTGVTLSAAGVEQYLLNVDHCDQVAVEITEHTNGTVDAWFVAADNG